MKYLVVSVLCILSAFYGSQSRGIFPTTDEILKVFEAVKNGSVQSVENSLSSVPVDSTDDHGYTFLMRAAKNGDEAMVDMLLKHGADVDKSDGLNKFTALQLANKERGCGLGSWECEPRNQTKYDRISELLIKNGADVNLVNAHGITLLHDVAQYGYDKVAKMIFENGGSKIVNIKSREETPLCFAAYYGGYTKGHDEVAKLMIQNGADVNLRCKEQTPLHLAARKDRLGIVKLLVENGANLSAKDPDGKTPLEVVKSLGYDYYKPVIEYLEQHEKTLKN